MTNPCESMNKEDRLETNKKMREEVNDECLLRTFHAFQVFAVCA